MSKKNELAITDTKEKVELVINEAYLEEWQEEVEKIIKTEPHILKYPALKGEISIDAEGNENNEFVLKSVDGGSVSLGQTVTAIIIEHSRFRTLFEHSKLLCMAVIAKNKWKIVLKNDPDNNESLTTFSDKCSENCAGCELKERLHLILINSVDNTLTKTIFFLPPTSLKFLTSGKREKSGKIRGIIPRLINTHIRINGKKRKGIPLTFAVLEISTIKKTRGALEWLEFKFDHCKDENGNKVLATDPEVRKLIDEFKKEISANQDSNKELEKMVTSNNHDEQIDNEEENESGALFNVSDDDIDNDIDLI